MQNLHLKNLNNTDIIDIYLNKIEKMYNNNYDFEKLITLLKKLYSHIEKELESIKIKNSKITNYTNNYIKSLETLYNDDISIMYTNRIDFEDDNNNIKKLKKLQNIDIYTKFNINNNEYLNYEKKKVYDLITIMTFRNTDSKLEYLELEVENNIIKNINIYISKW